MASYKKDVRILLVGDEKVGKTSLILSLVSEEFAEEVPGRAEEITIPADVTPEHVPTCIVDYSAQDQDETVLQDEIHKASVVCIVYSVTDEDSIQRLTTYWLPFLRHALGEEHRTPVILVGNKVDLTDVQTLESILPIMNDFGEVETCVECSARTLKNISEVFYYAQKAVLHPTAPVYNPDEKELTQPAKRALTRIFRICDLDNDNLLSDDEINMFQMKCFNAPLHPQALEDVKSIVKKNVCDGIIKDGITLKGFLFLHTLFIQKGRHETTWTVLRKFGYDDNLQLTTEYVSPQLDVPLGCTTELTVEGFDFLARLFHKYDEDKDGCLSPAEQQRLFNTCPLMPWGPDVNNTVSTNHDGWVTLDGYLAQWTLTCLLDVQRAIEFLAYLGYNYQQESQLSAIHVTREKRIDLEKRQTGRNVFRCHVLGAKSTGKTAFLQGLLSRNLRYVATLNRHNLSNFTINTVQVYGQDKFLMLHEIDTMMCDMLTPTELDCDVACLLYDVTNPQSFEFCATMYLKHFIDMKIPCLMVASKAEYPEVRQDYELTPAQFCSRFKLPPPQRFTCIDKVNSDVYVKLATMAAYPHLKALFQNSPRSYAHATIGVAVAALLGFAFYKAKEKRNISLTVPQFLSELNLPQVLSDMNLPQIANGSFSPTAFFTSALVGSGLQAILGGYSSMLGRDATDVPMLALPHQNSFRPPEILSDTKSVDCKRAVCPRSPRKVSTKWKPPKLTPLESRSQTDYQSPRKSVRSDFEPRWKSAKSYRDFQQFAPGGDSQPEFAPPAEQFSQDHQYSHQQYP